MANRKKDENEPVTEPVTEPGTEPELTTKERIAKMLNEKKASAQKAVEAAQKQADEAAALENLDIDSDVESMVDGIKTIDTDVAVVKVAMSAEIEPLNKQIIDIKAKPEYNFEEQNKTRKELYDALVEKVGETAAKMLTGGAKSTGTGAGRGRSGASREQVIKAICDDGLTFAECAEQYDHKGNKERTGEQKVGHLVGRHIGLAVTDGTVVKNDDGSYSRA